MNWNAIWGIVVFVMAAFIAGMFIGGEIATKTEQQVQQELLRRGVPCQQWEATEQKGLWKIACQ